MKDVKEMVVKQKTMQSRPLLMNLYTRSPKKLQGILG
jgi:hypothetical protein